MLAARSVSIQGKAGPGYLWNTTFFSAFPIDTLLYRNTERAIVGQNLKQAGKQSA
ncbi:MAG: hypothetical protein JRD88_06060 [Deltaproteobacteria bacterium]|jgi:hypothetical protein|nr:hypothetical protein [Deltaproteobacteria bacterium]